MTNIFGITDTFTLLQAVEQIKTPANYLTQTFFPNKMPTANTSWVAVEFKKGKRLLAPYIVRGSRGLNIARDTAQAKFYTAPMIGARRIISLQDVEMRMFGEQPIFSTMTPEQRAASMQARDLTELLAMIENRKNKICADIIQTGKTVIQGYADDGQTYIEDEIDFGFDGIVTPTVTWDNAGASIYDDLRAACDRIAENTGTLPTLMLCGKNVEKYLINNTEIFKWLQILNRENLTMAAFAPRYTAPQARYIGSIPSLGLEIHSYLETYYDETDGTVKPFLDPDVAIICNPGRGHQLTGAITLMEGGNFRTYAAEYVPHYTFNDEANQTSLAVFSRFIAVPDNLDDWVTIKTKG